MSQNQLVNDKHRDSKPQIRFGEFLGSWYSTQLGSISERVSERNKNVSAPLVLTNSAVRGVIPQADFFDKEIAVQGSLSNYYVARKDDFVYNPRISASAPVGPFKRNRHGGGVMSPLYNLYRFNEGEVLDFFEQYLQSYRWHGYMRSVANYGARSDRMAISTGDLSRLPLPYPSLPEQQKIASFLTTVDARIAKQEQKLSLLKAYKKGVMQKIFTQQIRFKDEGGKEYPEWREERLGGIAYSEPSSLSVNQIEGRKGAYKVYGASGVLQTLDTYVYEDEYIAVVKDGAGVGRIGLYDAKSSILGTLVAIQPGVQVSRMFLYYTLHLINFRKYTTGSTIPHIYFSQYSKERLRVPVAEEQQKISDFLSTLDREVSLNEVELDSLNKFKKALLQKMFV